MEFLPVITKIIHASFPLLSVDTNEETETRLIKVKKSQETSAISQVWDRSSDNEGPVCPNCLAFSGEEKLLKLEGVKSERTWCFNFVPDDVNN